LITHIGEGLDFLNIDHPLEALPHRLNPYCGPGALAELHEQGCPVLDEDVARLSAYARKHINVHGHYSTPWPRE
jgi:hypothetical protein